MEGLHLGFTQFLEFFKKIFKKRPKPKTLVISLLILVFGGIFLFDFAKTILIKKFFAGFKPPAVTISAVQAKVETWQPLLQTVGSLKAVKGVDLTAEVAGTVSKIYVQAGDEVQEGQTLIDLDDRIDQQSLANFQAQLELTQSMFKRQEVLIKEHAISKQDFDQASANLKQAQANVNKEEQMIAQKHIVAPFAGKLGIVRVSIGQYLTPGTNMVSLQAMDPLYVDFALPEQHLSELTLGEVVHLQVDAYPKESFTGKITAINSKINEQTRSVDLQATIPNPEAKLIPGLFGHLEVLLAQPEKLVTVPTTAITSSLYGDTVYVVEEKNAQKMAHQRVVILGETRGKEVAIQKGLSAGELVVTSGQLKLHDDSEVIIDNEIEL